jgi:hypothetical protein
MPTEGQNYGINEGFKSFLADTVPTVKKFEPIRQPAESWNSASEEKNEEPGPQVDEEAPKKEQADMLVAFNDGSYKKIEAPFKYKHSQWIHFTRENGKAVRINTQNVNYLEEV